MFPSTLKATDAVTAREALIAYDAVTARDELNAYEADKAGFVLSNIEPVT